MLAPILGAIAAIIAVVDLYLFLVVLPRVRARNRVL